MRLAIINLTAGNISGGYKSYLKNMLPLLAASPEIEAVLCASPRSFAVNDWLAPINKIQFTVCSPFKLFRDPLDFQLKSQLEKFSPDVIFIPVERYFKFRAVPVVNMLQNLEPFVDFDFGGPLKEKLKTFIRRRQGIAAIKRSARVIVVSESSRQILVNEFGIPAPKIGLVYHGIQKSTITPVPPADLLNSRPKDFLFTAGSIRPARGLKDLLLALKHLLANALPVPCLFIAGRPDPGLEAYFASLKKFIQKNNLASKVIWLGGLAENEMAWCFQNCQQFICTSRVESFGLTALESLSQGCLCLAAARPSLPEILAAGAQFYPPGDYKTLAQKITEIAAWPQEKKQHLRAAAQNRTAQFTWPECAAKTLSELKSALK